ncbi:MAG: hypothetical protein WHX93_08650 [bacterium]
MLKVHALVAYGTNPKVPWAKDIEHRSARDYGHMLVMALGFSGTEHKAGSAERRARSHFIPLFVFSWCLAPYLLKGSSTYVFSSGRVVIA